MFQMDVATAISKKSKKNKSSILLDIIEEPIKTNEYTNLRYYFSSTEYFPSRHISIVMKHHFESSELLYSYNENHGLYKIKIKDLLVDVVTNWE